MQTTGESLMSNAAQTALIQLVFNHHYCLTYSQSKNIVFAKQPATDIALRKPNTIVGLLVSAR